MYRVARNYPSLVSVHDWQWYLNQAVLTVATLTDGQVGYADDGLMGETVIHYLLNDLQREGLTANATLVQSKMKSRWQIWSTERYPYAILLKITNIAFRLLCSDSGLKWLGILPDKKVSTYGQHSLMIASPLSTPSTPLSHTSLWSHIGDTTGMPVATGAS